MEFARLERQRAVDAVYDALRQAIVSYLLKPGERLDVDDLAAKLGVSLTPVRGAVQRLASEGLIEVRPRSGTFVASLTVEDLVETFQIRCALECLAVEEAAGKVSTAEVRRLKELLRMMRRPVRDEAERKEHERNNSELHGIFIEASGNRRLKEMYDALNAHIQIARIHASNSDWLARLGEEQAEHEAIVEAVERHDGPAAAKAMRKHVYRAKDALVAALRQAEERPPEG